MNSTHRCVQGVWAAACVAAICWVTMPGAYAATYSGGSGMEGDPYLISTSQDLQDLSKPANERADVAGQRRHLPQAVL